MVRRSHSSHQAAAWLALTMQGVPASRSPLGSACHRSGVRSQSGLQRQQQKQREHSHGPWQLPPRHPHRTASERLTADAAARVAALPAGASRCGAVASALRGIRARGGASRRHAFKQAQRLLCKGRYGVHAIPTQSHASRKQQAAIAASPQCSRRCCSARSRGRRSGRSRCLCCSSRGRARVSRWCTLCPQLGQCCSAGRAGGQGGRQGGMVEGADAAGDEIGKRRQRGAQWHRNGCWQVDADGVC